MQLHSAYLNRHIARLPQDAANCASTIAREVGRMAEGVKELLANEAALQQSLNPESIDAVSLASSVSSTFLPLAEAKGQSISVDFPAAPLTIVADPAALRRVLENLLSNAVKFTPLGGTVEFKVAGTNGGIDFTVRDNGPGFTASDKLRAFSRYAKLSARPTGGETSTGLGLSIVKKLTEQMGGSVNLNSSGEGAVCEIHVPRGIPPA
jgi:two-component system sensor histidine kinase/response regulator